MSFSPCIQLSNATVGGSGLFQDSARIEQVTWSVHAGEFWVIGARPSVGKTDLLVTAAGLQKPIAGEHQLFGSRLEELSEEEREASRLRIGVVFENGGRLFNDLTVAENLALPVCYHRNCSAEEASTEVAAVLETTGLKRVAQFKPTEVSRSLHQRIALARALILKPEVLLIDNPLFNSDPFQTNWWLDFIPNLAVTHPNLTLVITTTDFRPWLEHGRQFAIIHRQQWLVLGDRHQVKQSDHPLVQTMLAGRWDSLETTDFI